MNERRFYFSIGFRIIWIGVLVVLVGFLNKEGRKAAEESFIRRFKEDILNV